jgi:prefoldin subunit 5
MFQRLLNNTPSTETAAIAARTLAEEPESDMHALKRNRAAIEAEIDGMQAELDNANEGLRELHRKRKGLSWEDANAYSGARPQIYAETDLGHAISEATHRSEQLRAAIEAKRTEVEKLTAKIHVIERELPGRLRREALEAAVPLVFELIDALCVAANHESEYVRLGGPVETPVPWQFMLAGGEGIELETIMSHWLRALKREGIRIPGDICDDSRHLPAPASVHARTQTDTAYIADASRRGVLKFIAGFKQGYMTRARSF